MKKLFIFKILFLAIFVCTVLFVLNCSNEGGGCGDGNSNSSNSIIGTGSGRVVDSSIPYGCDLSWVTEMEASGYTWKNSSGNTQDVFLICKNLGFNACRLRVWTGSGPNDSSTSYNGQADVIAKALRAAAQGMKLMIDFHLSDTWADPSNQAVPSAWSSITAPADMQTKIAAHVSGVLNALGTALTAAGYTASDYVKWIQIGNETNCGMIWTKNAASGNNCNWPVGYGTYPANYAAYVTAGYNAAKGVFSGALVGPHVSNMWKTSDWTWNLKLLYDNSASFDICFGSLYPKWSDYPNLSDFSTLLNKVKASITAMNSAPYNKPCLITEFGVDYTSGKPGYDAITSSLALTNSVSPVNVGLFYWEPECQGYNSYGLGAWDPSSKQPTLILTGN